MAASVPSIRMAAELLSPRDDALAPMPPGPLHWLRAGRLEVALAPEAGGRIAQIRYDGVDWLVAEREDRAAAIPSRAIAERRRKTGGCRDTCIIVGNYRRGHPALHVLQAALFEGALFDGLPFHEDGLAAA